VPTLRLCVLYGSQNKQQLLPYKTLRDWFLQQKWRVLTARYALSPYIKQICFVFKGLINNNGSESNCIESSAQPAVTLFSLMQQGFLINYLNILLFVCLFVCWFVCLFLLCLFHLCSVRWMLLFVLYCFCNWPSGCRVGTFINQNWIELNWIE
jgi:hypothetical protein